MATAGKDAVSVVTLLGAIVYDAIAALGDLALFAAQTTMWLVRRRPSSATIWPNFYYVGAHSVPVVAITGTFIGMVLAVQAYSQFEQLGLETRLGAIINVSIVRELGPV